MPPASPSPSSSEPVYADYNATSPLRPAARAAMVDAMAHVGNASSIHSFGRSARQMLETARQDCLDALGLPDHRLVFLSGATEALATCLKPGLQNLATKTNVTSLVMSPTEHVAALDGQGFGQANTQQLGVDGQGRVDPVEVEGMVQSAPDPSAVVVCVQGANSETGVLQPIAEVAKVCRQHQALFVSDMVQWVGRLPLPEVVADVIILSAHKVGGPTGVGALIYDPMRVHFPDPLIRGGGQERGVRAGTENLVGAVGLTAALSEASQTMADEAQRLAGLRNRLEAELKALAPHVTIFGAEAKRLPNTSSFALPDKEAALALMQLDLAGVAISSGSACSSGKVTASHVLKAMDVVPDIARGALRVSLGFQSTPGDVDRLVAAIKTLL